MKRLVLLALGVAAAWPAAAQEADEAAPATQPAEEAPASQPAVILPADDDGPIPEPNLPEDPLALVPPEEQASAGTATRYDRRDYPIELVRRPLTLPADLAEARLEVPLTANRGHPIMTEVLRGAFGVTMDLQLGLTYGVGLERLDAQPGEDGFEVGKAFSLDGVYTLIPGWLAAEARLAFFIDPDVFGLGLILGVPFKVEVGDRWALFGGADLLRIKLKEFAVDPADPLVSSQAVAFIGRGGKPSSGSANLEGGAAYQALPALAVVGTIAMHLDFDGADPIYSLLGGVTWSPRRDLDLGGRLGFLALDEPGDSFAVALFGALRI